MTLQKSYEMRSCRLFLLNEYINNHHIFHDLKGSGIGYIISKANNAMINSDSETNHEANNYNLQLIVVDHPINHSNEDDDNRNDVHSSAFSNDADCITNDVGCIVVSIPGINNEAMLHSANSGINLQLLEDDLDFHRIHHSNEDDDNRNHVHSSAFSNDADVVLNDVGGIVVSIPGINNEAMLHSANNDINLQLLDDDLDFHHIYHSNEDDDDDASSACSNDADVIGIVGSFPGIRRKESTHFYKPKIVHQQNQPLLQSQMNPMILRKKGLNRKGKSSRMLLRQTNDQETINKQIDILPKANNKKMSQFKYYKYSGRYRSRMLRMNRNYSSINNISSIDENNEVNENNSSNNQALLSGNIDIYHKQLGPGLSLVQYFTNDKGSVMIDDDIDSDRYSSWFLLSFNHHHNQSQPLTPLKALTTDYIQQSERSPYNDNDSKIRAFSTLRKTMLKQPLIKEEFNNNSSNYNDAVYDNQLNYNSNESSYSSDDNNVINNFQQNLYILKEKINFPRYLLKLQQSEKLPSVDILSLPKRVVISYELSINQINTQKEIKVTSSSLEKEEGDVDDDIANNDNDDHGIDNVDNLS